MDEPTTIEEFADKYSLTVGTVMYKVIAYMMSDATDVSAAVKRILLTATNDEITEALETIADDIANGGEGIDDDF